jgi:hypothetical protein
MGTYKDSCGVTCFQPDNDESTLYIESYGCSFADIDEEISKHFGDIDKTTLTISAETIHTNALYYDCYDASDYTNFIVIKLKG